MIDIPEAQRRLLKKLFLCIGIEKFEKYLTEICGFLPVIAALLSPRPPLNNKPLIHNGLAVFYAFFPKIPKFRGKIGEKIRVFSNLTVFDLQCLSFTCMYLHVEVIFHPIVLSELFNYLRLLSYKCSILDFSMLIRLTISFTYLHLLSSSCRYRLYTFRVKMHVLTCTCIYLHVKVAFICYN